MTFYSDMATDVDALLGSELGQKIIIKRQVAGNYDTDLGKPALAYISFESVGVVLNYPDQAINGTSIITGDRKVLMSAVIDAAPKVNDTLTAGDASYSVVSVKTLEPAGVNTLYTLQVRK